MTSCGAMALHWSGVAPVLPTVMLAGQSPAEHASVTFLSETRNLGAAGALVAVGAAGDVGLTAAGSVIVADGTSFVAVG